MDISVIMPAYNQGRFIREAVESVLRQESDATFEVLVVDDGSTDETVDVIRKIDDPRVRIFSVPKGGVSAARNFALDRAKGRYIAFLDADDRWLPGCLGLHFSILEAEQSVGFVFSDFARFRGSRRYPATHYSFIPGLRTLDARPSGTTDAHVIEGDTFSALMSLEIFPTWLPTTMVRSVLLEGIRFDPSLRLAQDVDFMNRVHLRGRGAFTDQVVAEIRRHGGNNTGDMVKTQIGYLTALHTTREKAHLSPTQRANLDRKIGKTTAGLGHTYFRRRRPLRSAWYYLKALAYPNVRFNALKHMAAMPALPFLPVGDDRVDRWG